MPEGLAAFQRQLHLPNKICHCSRDEEECSSRPDLVFYGESTEKVLRHEMLTCVCLLAFSTDRDVSSWKYEAYFLFQLGAQLNLLSLCLAFVCLCSSCLPLFDSSASVQLPVCTYAVCLFNLSLLLFVITLSVSLFQAILSFCRFYAICISFLLPCLCLTRLFCFLTCPSQMNPPFC